MADPPTNGAASLNTVNAEFLSARASRLDGAITKALESKVPLAPKAGKGSASATTTARASSSSAHPSTPASSTSSDPAATSASVPSGDADTEAAAVGADEAEAGAGEPAVDEAQDEPEAAEQTPIDRKAANALAKKRDFRALEKHLGLEEGVLGATNGDYAAYRRRVAELETRATEVETKHSSNNEQLIAKFGPAVDLIAAANKGDIRAYAALIERTTGVRVAQFVQLYAQNVPQMSARELQLEQENTRLRSQGRLLTEGGQVNPAPAATQATALATANTYVATEAKDHPALRLKGGLDDVRAKWLASFDKPSGSFKLTPKAAADAVVDDRRKAREQEDWVLSGKKPAKKPVTRSTPRAGASEMQPRKENLSREELIDRAARTIQRAKARERLGVR